MHEYFVFRRQRRRQRTPFVLLNLIFFSLFVRSFIHFVSDIFSFRKVHDVLTYLFAFSLSLSVFPRSSRFHSLSLNPAAAADVAAHGGRQCQRRRRRMVE